ncbi:hypothetical protein Nepgr_018600 [Nepenthes gracilis]|uniref:Uncharacterized protein n=1 Tax=Nepenthes gracilis TaxID=150966 RepID=A0AAD3STV1_NEPGR|nr:hypothetical protein Nepgr_018600 [Nepenthes gracilis]
MSKGVGVSSGADVLHRLGGKRRRSACLTLAVVIRSVSCGLANLWWANGLDEAKPMYYVRHFLRPKEQEVLAVGSLSVDVYEKVAAGSPSLDVSADNQPALAF